MRIADQCNHFEEGCCNLTGWGCTSCIVQIGLYTIAELRESVAPLHPATYRRLFATGRIPACKIGGQWYSTKSAVERYIRH